MTKGQKKLLLELAIAEQQKAEMHYRDARRMMQTSKHHCILMPQIYAAKASRRARIALGIEE